MRSIRTKNTGPELNLRRMLHKSGYRYRIHPKTLPGRPDIAFPSRRKVIFVHGCFWHSHGCSKGQAPKSRQDYWAPKLLTNKARDERRIQELADRGWSSLVVWQCELRNPKVTFERVREFLDP
jgi:DNA mismatch endonuclease (patch repair protein)